MPKLTYPELVLRAVLTHGALSPAALKKAVSEATSAAAFNVAYFKRGVKSARTRDLVVLEGGLYVIGESARSALDGAAAHAYEEARKAADAKRADKVQAKNDSRKRAEKQYAKNYKQACKEPVRMKGAVPMMFMCSTLS